MTAPSAVCASTLPEVEHGGELADSGAGPGRGTLKATLFFYIGSVTVFKTPPERSGKPNGMHSQSELTPTENAERGLWYMMFSNGVGRQETMIQDYPTYEAVTAAAENEIRYLCEKALGVVGTLQASRGAG